MPSDNQQRRILLGEITGVHGIRGEVVVRSFTAEPETIGTYGPLTEATGTRRFSLRVLRTTNKGIVARIDGIADRTEAEALRGTKLYIERAKLPAAEPSEFYHADLIGLRAIAPDGSPLGAIVAVQNFGAGDIIELKLEGTPATEFIPFEQQWVPDIDIAAGTVTINRPLDDGDEGPGDDEDGGSPDA
jgi:16S rRNA processing protein RimM